jgi:hypothetical protein
MSPFASPGRDSKLTYDSLELALAAHPGRWSEAAVACARALPQNGGCSVREWCGVLDALDRTVRDLSTPRSSSRLRR